jgi:hypothetical protein
MLDEQSLILNTKLKIEHQILGENCKRKAQDSILIKP